ncbi:MAG: outer membrane lipoprotein carrier protein LolA [Holosporaceae bacterium]|jgi:outer membrane lipoprotein-sorting protein|nr:outer membrane lipoprotein carrier protein LolA [Holosporaceae bacterium]
MKKILKEKKMLIVLMFSCGCAAMALDDDDLERILSEKETDQYVTQLEEYLNSLKTIVSEFVQISRYGEKSSGYFILKRPDKMKLYYLPPASDVIIAKNNKVTHYNRELKEKTMTSMHSSPLSFFLESKINLRKNVTVLSAVELKNTMIITFCKKNSDDDGAVALIFQKNPIKLLKWEIFNNKNEMTPWNSTKIILTDSKINSKKIPDDEFEKFSEVSPELAKK